MWPESLNVVWRGCWSRETEKGGTGVADAVHQKRSQKGMGILKPPSLPGPGSSFRLFFSLKTFVGWLLLYWKSISAMETLQGFLWVEHRRQDQGLSRKVCRRYPSLQRPWSNLLPESSDTTALWHLILRWQVQYHKFQLFFNVANKNSAWFRRGRVENVSAWQHTLQNKSL